MAYHHYPTLKPSNHTNHEPDGINFNFLYMIIFLGGISCICLYDKHYTQRRYDRREQNAIEDYEEPRNIDDEDDNEFPDIYNFYPNYLDRNNNNRIPNPVLAHPAPPAYENDNLNNPEPPSYDSIINTRAEAENNNSTTQSTV